MATKNELRVGIKFETNNRDLDVSKAKLNELLDAAQKIKAAYENADWMGNTKQGFSEAAQEAEKLSQIISKSWNTKLGQFDLSALKNNINSAYGGLANLKTTLEKTGPVGAQAFNQIASSVLSTNTQLKKSSALLDKMALTMANTIRFGISSSVFNNFTGSIQKAYSYVKNLDTSLNDIRIVSGQSADQMERFAKYANQSAKELGSSTLDYTKAALIYYQQGLSDEQVTERTDVTVKMANVLGASAKEVSDYMTAIWNNFDDGSKSLEHYADVITALGASTAASSEEIATGLEKFAAIGKTVGLTYEYATTALATVVAQTRQSADTVGTAFKTLFARIQDLELGKTLDDGTTVGTYAQALAKVGIDIKDQKGELKDMNTILDEMGAKWQTLSKDQQVALAQNVAGIRQYSQLMALMNNWDKFNENLAIAQNSTGELEKQQEIYLDSVEAHLKQLQAETEKFYDTLLDEKAIKSFTDLLTGALKTINTYLTGLGNGINPLLTLGLNAGALFSKQIGGAMARGAQNYDIETQNRDIVGFKNELANTIKSQYEEQGVSNPSEEKISAEAEYALRLEQIKKDITEEDYKQLQAEQEKYGALKESIAAAENWEDMLRETVGFDKEDTSYLETRNSLLLRANQLEAQANKEVSKLSDAYSSISEILEDINGQTGKGRKDFVKSKEAEVRADLEDLGVQKELQDSYVKRLGDARQHNTIAKEINELHVKQNELINQTYDKSKAFTEAAERRQNAEDGTLQKQREQARAIDENLTKEERNVELARAYQDTIRGVSIIFSSMSSIKGIFDVLDNDNLSNWDKFTSIVSVVATQGLMIAANWKQVNSVFSNFHTILEAQNVSLLKRQGVMAAENANQGINNKLKEDNIKAGVKQNIVNATGDTQRVGKTIPSLIAENTQLAIKNLLSGNWVAIAALAVGATAALAYATYKYVDALQQANSEEVKRKKELEASKGILEETQSAYKEFQTTLGEYQDARSKIDDLTEGTVEFYEAITKSNEEALKLIETLGLLQGKDYIIGTNGVITIKQEALDEGAYEESRKLLQAQANTAYRQYQVNQLERDKKLTDVIVNFTNTVNQGRQSKLSYEQGKTILDNMNNSKTTNLGDIFTQESTDTRSTITKVIDSLLGRETENTKLIYNQIGQVGGDITDAVAKFGTEYQKILAEGENERFQVTSKALYATMNKNQAQQFAQLNDIGKKAIITAFENPLSEARIQAQKFSQSQQTGGSKVLEDVNKYKDNPLAKGQSVWFDTPGITGNDIIDWGALTGATIITKAVSAWGAIFGGYDEKAEQYEKNKQKAEEINTENESKKALEELFTQINEVTQKIASIPGLSNVSSKQLIGATLASQNGTLTNDDLNMLTADELQTAIDNNLFTNLPEGVNNLGEVLDNLRGKMDEFGRSAERAAADLADYNAEIKRQADELGTTDTALKLYGDALSNAGKLTAKLDQDTAKATADSYKFNKAYNEGRKLYSDNKKALETYSKALKNNQEVSYDVADAVGAVLDKLAEMKIILSSKDLKNSNTLKNINKLLNGTEEEAREAYKELLKLSQINALEKTFGKQEDVVKRLTIALSSLKGVAPSIGNIYEDLVNHINSLNVGDPLDEHYASILSNMIENTNLTMEQINELANNLHIEIPVTYDVPKEFTVKDAKFTTAAKSTVHRYTGEMPNPAYDGKENKDKTITVDYAWVETVEAKTEDFLIPDKTNMKVTTTNQQLAKGANLKASPSSKKSGGGGGSKSEPKKVDPLDEEADRYHKVNTQITKVENSLKKLQSQQEKYLGSKLIDNLNKQWNELNNQIKNYNEKLKIANQEQAELASKLRNQGVSFGADGTISNYMQAFAAQEAQVNNLIAQYNALSAEQQEKWDNDKIIDNAKEKFNQFKEDMNRYDELISDFIPDLQQSIQDAIDKQIELNIQKFNMEITIRLDMSEATRDWNEWAKRALKGINSEDILGNAQARLQDFYTYINKQSNAEIQIGTKHVNDLLEQLYKMDKGEANIYGDNRSQAIEDLKTYYTQLMDSITGVIELQDDLHNAVLDEMDEVQDKFAKQVEEYGVLRDIISHDIKLIQLVVGEDGYGEMAKFYDAQQKNYEAQLDFERQQKDFWYAQMQAAEEGSKEWDSAREKWQDAVEEFNSLLEEGLQNAIDKFQNAINEIFKTLNNSITKGLGLDYINTEWDLINQNADRYLDTINATFAIRELEKKFVDGINKSDNTSVQQRLKKVMEEQLDILREKERITQYDIDRANKLYEIELARIALEEAQRNKSQMKLRRDSQGNYTYQYVLDKSKIEDAESELNNLYNSLYNFDKDRYNSVLNDIYVIWDNYQQAMAEAAMINDPELRAEKERLIQEQYNELMMQAEEDYQVSKYNLEESFFKDWVHLNDLSLEEYQNLSDNEKAIMLTEMIPTWKNGLTEMADAFAGENGFARVTIDAWNQIQEAQKVYMEDSKKLEEVSGQTFKTIIDGEDESIEQAEKLIRDNKDLIKTYENELTAVQNVYNKIKALRQEYEQTEAAAKKAAETAYKYWQWEQNKNADAAAKASATTNNSGTNNVSTNNSGTTSTSNAPANNSGGDGVPTVGETVTYTGGKYYSDSYGGGPSGQRGQGKKVKITRIVNGRPYPIHVTSNDSAYGWLKQNQISGYDTGGYTGDWSTGGKLAFLHQKELVLNAKDTENMLNTVAIMRTLAYSLGSEMLAKLAGVGANGINNYERGNDILKQDVKIEASFPNVHDAADIEQALNNLVNAASQKIMEDR